MLYFCADCGHFSTTLRSDVSHWQTDENGERYLATVESCPLCRSSTPDWIDVNEAGEVERVDGDLITRYIDDATGQPFCITSAMTPEEAKATADRLREAMRKAWEMARK